MNNYNIYNILDYSIYLYFKEVDATFFKQQTKTSRSWDSVLKEDLNYCDNFWEDKTAVNKQSHKFLEDVKKNFLVQIMVKLTRGYEGRR